MTFGTDQKRHLLNTFRKCYIHSYPKGVSVHIGDGMTRVKQKPDDKKTTQEYMEYILAPAKSILGDPTKSISHYYLVLDKGSNIAKSLFAHGKRNVGVVPMKDPEDGKPLIYLNSYLPVDWKGLTANRSLTRREVYPLWYHAYTQAYTPPPGKCITIDGAPNRWLSKEEFDEVGYEEMSKVYFARTYENNPEMPVQMSSREALATPMVTGPTCIRGQAPPEEYRHECAEGDLSAFFYVNKHFIHPTNNAPHVRNLDILMDTNDGDTVMIALLHAKDRIDPVTSRFRNRVWVLLRGSERTREAYQKRKEAALKAGKPWVEDPIDGRDVYININMLYKLMYRHEYLKNAQDPVLTAVSLYILSGTDFFGDFSGDEYSLFYYMNWEKCVWDTWCRHSNRFSHMIMLFYSGDTTYGQPELLRKPYIDEDAILNFLYQCYGTKYGNAIRAEYGSNVRITPKVLEEFTSKTLRDTVRKEGEEDKKWEARLKRAKKLRIPPPWILTRYVRLLLGNVIYWINDYRPGGHKMFDPLEIYKGQPYYGFMKDPEDPSGKRYTLSPMCSISKPVPSYCIVYIGKHRKKDQGAPVDAAKVREDQIRRHRKQKETMERLEKHQKAEIRRQKRDREDAPAVPQSRLPPLPTTKKLKQ